MKELVNATKKKVFDLVSDSFENGYVVESDLHGILKHLRGLRDYGIIDKDDYLVMRRFTLNALEYISLIESDCVNDTKEDIIEINMKNYLKQLEKMMQ